ncbi:hypothetical protein [Chroococcidiopsis sp. SAG 2025]|nr:hypothetical protein [Chroococcidiopsis sp. SAG 2025]
MAKTVNLSTKPARTGISNLYGRVLSNSLRLRLLIYLLNPPVQG